MRFGAVCLLPSQPSSSFAVYVEWLMKGASWLYRKRAILHLINVAWPLIMFQQLLVYPDVAKLLYIS